MSSRPAVAGPAIAVAIAVGLSVLLHVEGRHARRMCPAHEVVEVHDGAGALAAWRASGVRGRVMLWLDRQLPIVPVGEPAVAAFLRDPSAVPPGVEESYLYLAMRANLVRRAVYLVPDDRWGAYAQAARGRTDLRNWGSGFVQVVEGVPVVLLSAADRGEALDGEPPLVHRGTATRELFGEATSRALDAEAARADLVTERQ